jgi:type I restriction enzyme, S subunit
MSTSERTVTLADLADLIGIQIDPRDQPEALYIGLEHVGSGRFIRVGGGIAADVQSSKFAFKQNDVLYGKLRPYLDKAVLADQDGVCTTELLVLRAKERIDPRFLMGVVHCRDFIEHAVSGTTGSQHPRTSWHRISEFELPNFTPEEQSKIADLTWTTHNVLLACEEAIDAGTELKRAAMRELFTRGLRGEAQRETEIGLVPESWSVVDFKSVREWLQYGTSVRCSVELASFPVLRIPNIEPGRVNADGLKYCDLSPKEAENYSLEGGDLIFIRTNGVLERLGSCAVYAGAPERALFASYLIRARLRPDAVDPRFVAFFFGSECGTSLVAGRATPAADGKYNLNTGTIDSLPLPLPPSLDEQREIVSILDAIDQKIDLHKRKRAVLEELFKTLLHKLMTGEIPAADLDLSALKPAEKAEAAE